MSSSPQTTISPSSVQLITDALIDYSEKTGIALANYPFADQLQLSKSPDDILQLLQERERAFIEYRNRNRTLISCFSPAVRVLHAFGKAVSLVPFPPAKAIFVAVDVLLTAASGVGSSYDALLDLFEYLGNFVKRLEIYIIIPPTPLMTDIVIKIMVKLLEVLALATKQIKHGRFLKFAKKLLGESEVEAVLLRLDRLTQEEARMTVAQTLGVVHGLVNNVRSVMEDGKASTDSIRQELVALRELVNDETKKMKRDQFQMDVQRWLSPPDPSTNHDFVWKGHKSGTAEWFFESNVLRDWKAKGSLLWIHGNPGSGKSTLLSAIIQEIEGMCSAGLASMAYYYFDFRDDKKQDRYGLLSSLLSQLSAERDSFYDILSQLYSANAGGTRKPTSIALTQCMKDMLSLPGQDHIYIIVDALDECPNISGTPSAREEVLDLVEGLVNLKLPNVHVCLASRPEIDIRKVLDPLTSLRISLHNEMGQKGDILAYIQSIVRSDRTMRRWKEEDKQLVIDILSDKADGMFRWVVCQIDRLRRTFPASIRNALNELPKTLDETYANTLLGIDEEKRRYAQRLFQCLTVSIRPLHVEELAEILAIHFDDAARPTFNAEWRPADAEGAVLSACSTLISVVNVTGSRIVQFSHFSVKEYLTSERLANAEGPLSSFHILLEPAHTILAHASLSVLLRLDHKIDRNTILHLPLAQYAARHWVDHVQFKDVSSQVWEAMKLLFDPAKTHFVAWVWLYDIDRHWVESMSKIHPPPPSAGPLYYASYCGFRGLVNHLITTHSLDINARGGSHTTALHAASAKGNSEVASLLLSWGADPNSRDNEGGTPLHKVSEVGHVVGMQAILEIMRLLLRCGANADARDNNGFTPLHIASLNGHRDIVELFLEYNTRIDERSWGEDTPLMLACKNGMLGVARLLVDRGSDLKARNRVGRTPLHIAARYGHVDIARLLLDRGADVNAYLAAGETPLHFVSGHGHLELAKLLIERGAEVDSRNERQETPLGYASWHGHFDITRLLIEHGARVDSGNEKHETPLDYASAKGNLDIARLLIEHGAEVDSRNEKMETPLGYASARGHLNIARLLIERGASPSSRDINGWTPLHTASSCGSLQVAKFLLESGINVDIRTRHNATSLHLAASTGKLNVVHILIAQGADIHARDKNGDVPLHVASQSGHVDVVRLLLDTGTAVDIRNEIQRTPLALASRKGQVEVSNFLIERGANLNALDKENNTPLHLASQYGHLEMTRLLLDHGADANIQKYDLRSPFHLASAHGHLEVAKLLVERGVRTDSLDDNEETVEHTRMLIDHGVNQHITDYNGSTPLNAASRNGHVEAANVRDHIQSTTLDTAHHGTDHVGKYEGDVNVSLLDAAYKGDLGIVQSLLGQGADINTRNDTLETPLDRAVCAGKVEMVHLLLECGAEVDPRDNLEWTPLHGAAQFGYLEILRVLIDHGANADSRDVYGLTPLHMAADYGHLEICRTLIDHGANLNARERHNQTSIHFAIKKGHLDIVELLRGRGADVSALNIEC